MTTGEEDRGVSRPLTPDEIDRLEWLLGTVKAKRLVGEPLTDTETILLQTLDELTEAIRQARDAFSTFYTALPEQNGGNAALPGDVAARITHWMEARRRWDTLVVEFLQENPAPPPAPVRTGPRLKATLPEFLRVPTALPARDLFSLFFAPALWKPDADGLTVSAQRGTTQVRIECDEITGLGPEQAIHQIAKHGASVAQTFFALVGLYLERNPGPTHETYLTVYASDLLRFQQRKQRKKGGYPAEEIMAKGRDVYLLSRISVPNAETTLFEGGKREARRVSLGRLLSLESLETLQIGGEPGADPARTGGSVVRFRYHLGREVYGWVNGDRPQFAVMSGKLLTYHPLRQKYQILLGFCLTYYERVNRKHRTEEFRLRLPALLNLAAIDVPDRRIAEFFSSVEDALEELARDGVIFGLKLVKPSNWPELLEKRQTRRLIADTIVIWQKTPQRLEGGGKKLAGG